MGVGAAVARLRHQHIVQVYDFDVEDGMYFMVMEFVEGPTLKAELKQRAAKGQIFSLPDTSRILAALASAIDGAFGGFTQFRERFTESAATNFGSGWTWLVMKDGELEIVNTSNAGCPLTDGMKPLLTVDVWEHAYYIDKRNARPAYLDSWWNVVNWDFVASQM